MITPFPADHAFDLFKIKGMISRKEITFGDQLFKLLREGHNSKAYVHLMLSHKLCRTSYCR